MTPTVVTAVVAAVSALAGGGLWTYLLGRRTNSGRVITSPAEVLWTQAQNLITDYEARLTRTEDQRDKLLVAYESIGPALKSIDESLRKLLVILGPQP